MIRVGHFCNISKYLWHAHIDPIQRKQHIKDKTYFVHLRL